MTDKSEWVLVPREPSREMLKAAYDLEDKCAIENYGGSPPADDIYAAMLSARPTPPDDLVEAIAREIDDWFWDYLELNPGITRDMVSANSALAQSRDNALAKARRILALIQKEGER